MNLSRLERTGSEQCAGQTSDGLRVWRLPNQQQEVCCYDVGFIRQLVGSKSVDKRCFKRSRDSLGGES